MSKIPIWYFQVRHNYNWFDSYISATTNLEALIYSWLIRGAKGLIYRLCNTNGYKSDPFQR